MDTIIIATIKSWNIKNTDFLIKKFNKKFIFHIITKKEDLTFEKIAEINPKYIFFPHWSWIIPKEIYSNFECILFHMTDLPYGRGGSPLQNLIMNGKKTTKISAIKVVKELDAGPIYLKENFNIRKGSAEELFIEMSSIIFNKMIPLFFKKNYILPIDQVGEPVIFTRRKPEQSNLLNNKWENKDFFYDFIRMLDAEGYPRAYIEKDNIKIEFSEIYKNNGKLTGRFEVYEK